MTVDPVTFRRILAEVPMPVAVVTTTGPRGEPYGMTVGSFGSLSLEPPLVLFCVARTARSYPPLCAAGRYCINVLDAHQEQIARRFASRDTDRFGTDIVTVEGLPAIGGALVHLVCARHGVVDGGDHSIIVARVLSAGTRAGSPLLYQNRCYRTIGCRPEPPEHAEPVTQVNSSGARRSTTCGTFPG